VERPEGFHHHPGGPGGWNPRTNDIDLDEQRKTIAARPGEGGKETPRAPKGLDKHRGTPPVWLPHPWRGPLDADGL
jgi:hypothetical protein